MERVRALTEADIRSSFVNASKREAAQAGAPDLAAVDWDRTDVIGWRDAKRPLAAYVVTEHGNDVVAVLLRTAEQAKQRRRLLCSWCEDVQNGDDALLYVARRAGAAGRRGNTIGTSICADFACSRNVRRVPSVSELGSDDEFDRQRWNEARIANLRTRVDRFVDQVLHGS